MVLVQTLLNASLRPVRQRLERPHIRLLLDSIARLKYFNRLFPGLLPSTSPYKTPLGDFTCKYVFLKRKVEHVRRKNNSGLQELLQSTHVFL